MKFFITELITMKQLYKTQNYYIIMTIVNLILLILLIILIILGSMI